MKISKRVLVVGLVVGLMLAAVVTPASPTAFMMSAVTMVLVIALVGFAAGLIRR